MAETAPSPAQTASLPAPMGAIRFAYMLAVVAAVLAVWLLLPTAPNYDTASHLVWANELLHGAAPDVAALAAPTPHPLWLLLAIPAQLTGYGAELMQLLGVAALFASVACAYRLAAGLGGPVAGVVAGVSVGSSFALLLLAFKAYVDLPFLALVITALVLEQERRGGRWGMPLLMFAAGLLRPEAWAYGLLLIALRVVGGSGADDRPESLNQRGVDPRGARWRGELSAVVVVLAAPVLWMLADFALTGDLLHSLTGTQELAQELGRKTGLVAAPGELVVLLGDLARPPVAAAGLLGLFVATRVAGVRAARLPIAVFVAGCFGFLVVGALGLPLLQRYLLIPAVLACVFAGVAAVVVVSAALGRAPDSSRPREDGDGDVSVGPAWAGVPPTVVRAVGVLALVGALVGAGGYLALKAGSFRVLADGVLQEARWQRDAAELIDRPRIRAQRCGPITMPTYRFVPELTLAAGLREGDVVSRATELGGAGPQPRGQAIVINGDRPTLRRLAWAAGVDRATNAVPTGFRVIAHENPFLVASRC